MLPAVWVVLGAGLSSITGRVGDWFVMTDELLYERFAINSARYLTPLAHLHGKVIPSLAQLYPLLIAPFYRSGFVPHDLHEAHLFNAWLMSSACIPAFLLARRVTGRAWAAYLLAFLAVVMPSIVYASYLLTEAAGYPAFLWALLAMHLAVAAPSPRHDVLALLGMALAFFARTQFAILVVILPLAVLACEVGASGSDRLFERIGGGLRASVRCHTVLAPVYAVLVAAAIGLRITGHLASVLGIYASTLGGGLPPHLLRSVFEHLATVALGIGILPALVGLAWLLANLVRPAANREAHAFACLGVLTALVLIPEVAIFDLRIGAGQVVYDRYLFYLAPVFLLGALCALCDEKRPRWSLLVATILIAAGFALNDPPRFEWQQFATLSPDAPIAVFYRPIDSIVHGLGRARVALALTSVLLAALFALAAWRLRPRLLNGVVAALLVVTMPVQTYYVFHRLFTATDWAGRPITYQAQGTQDWVDAAIGTGASLTEVPSAVSSDFYVNQQTWRDFEFWNKSVERVAYYDSLDSYRYTGNLFPQTLLRIDPKTGVFNESPTPWVAQSAKDTRFQVAGRSDGVAENIVIVDAGAKWRADWMSFGIYDDGWTKPGQPVRVRVFAAAGQKHSETRTLAFAIRPPGGVATRPVSITSNLEHWHGVATASGALFAYPHVCVPARGYTDVTIDVNGHSTIPGDLSSPTPNPAPRQGGVFLGELALGSEIGKPC
ncbi:MAG TPA: hypothetical protein VMV08_06005 [Gaiellaceae bacterium]|nr:hypothetical protein [Gaiellaceae bacterium]